jgi:hypothetical protein
VIRNDELSVDEIERPRLRASCLPGPAPNEFGVSLLSIASGPRADPGRGLGPAIGYCRRARRPR